MGERLGGVRTLLRPASRLLLRGVGGPEPLGQLYEQPDRDREGECPGEAEQHERAYIGVVLLVLRARDEAVRRRLQLTG